MMNEVTSKGRFGIWLSCLIPTQRIKVQPLMVVLVLLLSFPVNGETASYTFTKIADLNDGPFRQFGHSAINNKGTVAFNAAIDGDDLRGLFIGDGTTITPIFSSTEGFGVFSINDSDIVVFQISSTNIFISNGTTITTIADTSGPFSSFFGGPVINNPGLVVFNATPDAGGEGVFTSDGKTITTIADTTGPFSVFLSSPSINNEGKVVFTADLDTGSRGIFTGDGKTITTIADTTERFSNLPGPPSINDKGIVAFNADLDAGGVGIFTGDGKAITPIAFVTSFTGGPVINNEGTVAFLGAMAGKRGIFTGPDPIADKVIAQGDPLFGSTVISLNVFNEWMNDLGQITFRAILANGNDGIYRADPVPQMPPNCSTATPSISKIWPPDHNFVPVNILGVTDPDGDPVSITIDSIHQDEPTTGSGDTCPDANGVGTSTAQVRAERVGNGDGRVYHIGFTADDGKGGTCTGEVTVCVPHDQGKGSNCVDEGPQFDSTVCK